MDHLIVGAITELFLLPISVTQHTNTAGSSLAPGEWVIVILGTLYTTTPGHTEYRVDIDIYNNYPPLYRSRHASSKIVPAGVHNNPTHFSLISKYLNI